MDQLLDIISQYMTKEELIFLIAVFIILCIGFLFRKPIERLYIRCVRLFNVFEDVTIKKIDKNQKPFKELLTVEYLFSACKNKRNIIFVILTIAYMVFGVFVLYYLIEYFFVSIETHAISDFFLIDEKQGLNNAINAIFLYNLELSVTPLSNTSLVFDNAKITVMSMTIFFFFYFMPSYLYVQFNHKKKKGSELFINMMINSISITLISYVIKVIITGDPDLIGASRAIVLVNMFNFLIIQYFVGPIDFIEDLNIIISYTVDRIKYTLIFAVIAGILVCLYINGPLITIYAWANYVGVVFVALFGAEIVYLGENIVMGIIPMTIYILVVFITLFNATSKFDHVVERCTNLKEPFVIIIYTIVINMSVIIFTLALDIAIATPMTSYIFEIRPIGILPPLFLILRRFIRNRRLRISMKLER